ncbi:hypothetical protein FACS1894206_04250 [Deltaproteobacteria bacterium]|nr:hypothetical protein FACS1894206_04250 [Deltaproteobacteria bacterium]
MTVMSSVNDQVFDPYSKYNAWVEKYPGRSGVAGAVSGLPSEGLSALLSSDGRAEVAKALEAMKKEGYTSFSFADIEDYRRKLEEDFTNAVRSDLKEMGVDPEIQFQLVLDASGAVKVITSSEDKGKIEQYLQDNEAMVDVFKHIQALSNLKKTAQKSGVSDTEFTARNLKRSLQAEAMQAFFNTGSDNGADYFSQIANFSSNDMTSYFLGVNSKV